MPSRSRQPPSRASPCARAPTAPAYEPRRAWSSALSTPSPRSSARAATRLNRRRPRSASASAPRRRRLRPRGARPTWLTSRDPGRTPASPTTSPRPLSGGPRRATRAFPMRRGSPRGPRPRRRSSTVQSCPRTTIGGRSSRSIRPRCGRPRAWRLQKRCGRPARRRATSETRKGNPRRLPRRREDPRKQPLNRRRRQNPRRPDSRSHPENRAPLRCTPPRRAWPTHIQATGKTQSCLTKKPPPPHHPSRHP